MTSRKLYFIVPGALEQRTGGYVYDARIVEGLRRAGWIVHVHSLDGSFPDVDATAAAAMAEALESIPDGSSVVVDGLAMGGLPGPINDQGYRLRIVSLIHHPLAEETGLSEADQRRYRASEGAALGQCVGVIVTSEFTAGVVAEYGVPTDRVRVVPPGMDRVPAAEGPGDGEAPALLCVATLTPRKGHDVLVDALDRVRDLPWTCTFVGGLDRAPDFVQEVRDRVEKVGLADRIHFVGERAGKGLERLYRGASVFVLASHYEGYGMALSEAISAGLPLVSTTGGAIPTTVPADASVLVPPRDPEALAGALREVLENDARREELAAAARKHAGDFPDWDRAAATFAEAVAALTA
jgi:glycosyltransferase involved in cell wall biosynthesis